VGGFLVGGGGRGGGGVGFFFFFFSFFFFFFFFFGFMSIKMYAQRESNPIVDRKMVWKMGVVGQIFRSDGRETLLMLSTKVSIRARPDRNLVQWKSSTIRKAAHASVVAKVVPKIVGRKPVSDSTRYSMSQLSISWVPSRLTTCSPKAHRCA